MSWPIKLVEEYLIKTNHYNTPKASNNFGSKRELNQVAGLALADKYDLAKLRSNIFKNIERTRAIILNVGHKVQYLDKRTKYLLMRRCAQEEPRELGNGELSTEVKTIVKIMDNFFL